MEADTTILASALRIALFAIVVMAVFTITMGKTGKARASGWLTWALVFVILASASMAIEYSLFWFPSDLAEARASGGSTLYYYYNLSAALIFMGAQVAAAVDVARGDRRYLAWLLPAVAYIVLIGLVGLVGFGMTIAIPADLLRASLIIGLVLAHERARPSSHEGAA